MSREVRQHRIDLLLLYLFPVISYYGYCYVGLNLTMMKALYFIALPLMIIYVWRTLRKRGGSQYFIKMRQLSLLMVFSMVMAWLLWSQPFVLSYRVTAGSLAIVYYFFLVKGGFSKKEIETYIWVNAFLWIVMWLLAFSMAPTRIFGVDLENELDDARGIFRISIAGSACIFMAYFMSLNRWVRTKKKKYIVLIILFFTFIVLMTVRQRIIFSLLVGIYYLIRKVKYSWLYVLVLFIGFQFISIKIEDDSVIGSLLELSERQLKDQKSGDTYIRLLEYEYFFTQYNTHPLAVLFGNGVPHTEHSFGRRELRIQDTLAYFQSDVGYAKIYVLMGLVGLIVFLRLLFISIRQKVNDDMIYAKLFIIYIALVHIGTMDFLSCIIVVCIAIYLLDKYGKETSQVQCNDSRL